MYWDGRRAVKGEEWDQSLTDGLLNSICFFPILSYGSTAPLAALSTNFSSAAANGWSAEPLGRQRLTGGETDPEDGVLKVVTQLSAALFTMPSLYVCSEFTQAIFPR